MAEIFSYIISILTSNSIYTLNIFNFISKFTFVISNYNSTPTSTPPHNCRHKKLVYSDTIMQ